MKTAKKRSRALSVREDLCVRGQRVQVHVEGKAVGTGSVVATEWMPEMKRVLVQLDDGARTWFNARWVWGIE